MQIINIIKNMNDIRQERSNKGPTLKFNKTSELTSLNRKLGTHVKESMAFQTLKK